MAIGARLRQGKKNGLGLTATAVLSCKRPRS
jgi:hypothetical protein